MSEFISPKAAADFLGVCPNTLRNWEISKKLVAVKTLGGHRRYYFKDIEMLKNNVNCEEKDISSIDINK